MTDVFDVVRAANPIKDIDRYAEVVSGIDAQFHDMSWRDRMIDETQRISESDPIKETEPRRRMWIGAVAAAVVLVLAGLGLVLSSSNTDPIDVAAPTTAATQVPVTTGIDGGEDPGTAVATTLEPTPLDTVELFMARWTAADSALGEELISPAATASCYDCPDPTIWPWADSKYRGIEMRTMALISISGAGATYSCAGDGDVVTCSIGYETHFAAVGSADNPSSANWVSMFTVENGLITHLDLGAYSDIEGTHASGFADYEKWLAENYPNDHEELFFLGTLLVTDPDQREAHRGFVAEWAASR